MLLLAALGVAQASPWQASASDQVQAQRREDARDGSQCLDYDFGRVSGYAVLRRAWPQQWPAHYRVQLQLKGSGATGHDVQLKFVDASGDNVWWVNRPALPLAPRLQALSFQPRHIEFAWGPTSDRRLRQTQFVELVVVAGLRAQGRKGSVCLKDLQLQVQPEPAAPAAAVERVSPGHWQIDLGAPRDFSGLRVEWPNRARRDYEIQASRDGRRWQRLQKVRQAQGPRDLLFLGEQQWRHLRIRHSPASGHPQVQLRDAGQWPHQNAMLAEAARALPKGWLPRAFLGEQNYWTLIGVDGGGTRSGLLSEDGAVELWPGGPSVEPMLRLADGRLLGWADVAREHALPAGSLPQPIVRWRHPAVHLDIDAGADGPPEASALLARYRLHNPGREVLALELLWVLRPWQVNPPQQFLSTPGGVAPLPRLAWQNGALQLGPQALRPSEAPAQVQALPFAGGLGLPELLDAPPLRQLADPQALPSVLLRTPLRLAPGETRQLGWSTGADRGFDGAALDARLHAAAQAWQQRLHRVALQLPPPGQRLEASVRSALAHMLQSRDGAMLRPGTRSYARAWVRDGAMMVAGLLRMGESDAARAFADAYQPFVFESGKVPCCVDPRGADPVVENDSHGQYLYTVAEVFRHTQDLAWLRRHWPTVQKVLAWQEGLRQSERKTPGRTFGLMPPSISHEGYSDKPAYSYWDNLWALRGYKDAVQMAEALGETALAATWAGWRDAFARELAASYRATARHYGIEHLAGAADRGDFDPSSSSVMLNPADAEDLAPALLRTTYTRYLQEADARAAGATPWKDYTPYELRNVGALTRLGEVAGAHRLLDFFFRHQRPAGWQQWAEVVLPAEREPRFLGDMPHAWVSSDYLRAVLDLLAFERGPDLVLAAGIPADWLAQGELRIERLSTPWGLLSYRLRPDGEGWRFELLQRPPRLRGQLRLVWNAAALPRALHGGQALPWQGRELPIPDDAQTLRLLPTP